MHTSRTDRRRTGGLIVGGESRVRLISVEPFGDGWAVWAEPFENALLFLRGGAAEGAARFLAERFSKAGLAVEMEFRLRDGAAARFAGAGAPINDMLPCWG
jgi:hypothetical protein